MRKVLSLTLGAILVLLFFLLLGCGGGRSAPTAIGPGVSSSQFPDLPQGAGNFLGVPYRPDGSIDSELQKQIAVVASGTGAETRVTISAEDVIDLTTFTYELRYDPDLYNPVKVDYGEFMPVGDDLISFSYTDEPGVVSVAKVFIHPDEATGVSGSGVLATVTFENRPYAGAKSAAALPSAVVDDFVQDPDVVAPDMGVMWTSSFFRGDGNQDSVANIADITPLAVHFNESTDTVPEAAVADYNDDTAVTIADITQLAVNFLTNVDSFEIMVATDAEDGTYETSDGTASWADATGTAETGFSEFHYTLAGDYSTFSDIWVKVRFTDGTDFSELNEVPVHFTPGGPPPTPPINIVPGTGYGAIEIQIENTTNTTGGSRDGTDMYAPVQGTAATGDVTANDDVTLRLTGVHYLYEGSPYGIGEAELFPDPATYPEFGGQTGYDNIIAVLQELLVADSQTQFVSGTGDLEAFTEVPKQAGDRAYSGTIGPNSPVPGGSNEINATAYVTPPLSMTGEVETTFFAAVDLSIQEDGNAPEIWLFDPQEMPQNDPNPIVTLSLDFGWDDWPPGTEPPGHPNGTAPEGEEFTNLPASVRLVDTSGDPWVVMEFTSADDPGTPEDEANTPDPPLNSLTYTYQIPEAAAQRPGEPEDGTSMATMAMQAYVPVTTMPLNSNWRWRVIETEQRGEPPAGVDIRSSIYVPGEVFHVAGMEFMEVDTFPMDNIYPLEPSSVMYIVPDDPMVRLNPIGSPGLDPSGEAVIMIPDDEAKFNIIKREGDEFSPLPFDFLQTLPAQPAAYYVMGSTPPATVDDGTLLGEQWLQWHNVGYNLALISAEAGLPGDVSIRLFDRQGLPVADVTRNFVDAPGPGYRATPVIDGTTDFGVNVWDANPAVPDFSNKIASKGANDIVVFQVKNLWFKDRDTDNGSIPANSATHLILYTDYPEHNPYPGEIQVIPREFSTSPAIPSLVSIDPAAVRWWNNPDVDHEIGNGNWVVAFRSSGSGESAEYPDVLTIAP